MKKIVSVITLLAASSALFADGNPDIPALSGGLQSDANTCLARTAKVCGDPRSEHYHSCVVRTLSQENSIGCQQVFAIYMHDKILPSKLQKIDNITVYTLYHLGDGITSYHMVDSKGHLIELVDNNNDAIKDNLWAGIKKHTPNAALMAMVVQEVKDQPMVKHNQFGTMLVFSQPVSAGGCVACQTVGIAQIGYQFKPDGKFANVKWFHYKKIAS